MSTYDTINQPGTYGTAISVEDWLGRVCARPSLNITALNEEEMSELMLLGFDMVDGTFDGKGKLGISKYGDRLMLPNKSIKEKNIFKIFSGQELDLNNNSVTVTELANDSNRIEATADIVGSTSGVFTTVSGFQATDTIRIIKSNNASITIPATVKITAVDTVTNTLTFDTTVTIQQGDTIEYLFTDAFGCQNNTKRVSTGGDAGVKFDYYTQFFSREVPVDLADFNKVYAEGSQQYDAFIYNFLGKQSLEMFKEVARSFRYGTGSGGAASKIRGYNTIIEERDAAGLESILDFSGYATAQDHQKAIATVLRRVNTAPIDAEFILIANNSFHQAWENMETELYDAARAANTCELHDTLFNGIMKWNLKRSPLVKFFLSQQLSREEPYRGVAYILPKSLIAGYTPAHSKVDMSVNGKIQLRKAMFGEILTREKVGQRTAECAVYEHYMRLGFIFSGVSYRDTYFRIDDFNFGL